MVPFYYQKDIWTKDREIWLARLKNGWDLDILCTMRKAVSWPSWWLALFLRVSFGRIVVNFHILTQNLEIQNSPAPFFIKPITNAISGKIHSGYLDQNYQTHFNFLEHQLNTAPEGGKYLCGRHLTGADILMSFPLIAAKESSSLTGLTVESFPKLYAYIKALEKEPGYERAVQKIIEVDGKFQATF